VDAFYKKKSNGSTLSGKQPIPFENKSTSFEIKTESKPKTFRSLSISPDLEPPVWTEKKETDDAYNECVRVLVKAVREDISRSQAGARGIEGKGWLKSLWPWDPKPSTKRANIGVLFGTHNWDSCRLVLDELVDAGLATRRDEGRAASLEEEVVDKVAVAQLYGGFSLSFERGERLIRCGFILGMCDDLTDWIVRRTDSKTPFVVKCVFFGLFLYFIF
jgi:proline dehydrogenase